jgi:predicted dehydrogenase
MSSQVFHAPLITSHSRFKLTHVVERTTTKSKEIYPSVTVVKTLEELLESPVHLVIIATPSSQHFNQAKLCILANKHVIVEKPFTVTADEASQLIEFAKDKKKVLTVFHNRRWDGDFQTVTEVFNKGALGKISEIEIHYDRFRNTMKGGWREKPEPGSGIVYDLGSHLIDQTLCLMDHRVPDAVFADIRKQRDEAEVDDYFDIDLRYNHLPHLKITLRAGMLVKLAGPRYTIHGTSGTFQKYGTDVQEDQLKNKLTPANFDQFGVEPTTQWGRLVTETEDQTIETKRGDYSQFYTSVADAIQTGNEPSVTAAQARDVIRVIEAALESAKLGKIVVLTA